MANRNWWDQKKSPPLAPRFGNSIQEVQQARGGYPDLDSRIDAIEAIIPSIRLNFIGDVPAATTEVLMEMVAKNLHTTPSEGSLLYGIRVTTDSEVIDSAAGISVQNNGHSDNIYLGVRGKATASFPTGLGIDLNKASGGGEQSSASGAFGIQIYDWSTTDIGVDGPHGLYVWKAGNQNSQHPAIEVSGNRNAIRMIVSPLTGGFSSEWALASLLRSDDGSTVWQDTSGGDRVYIRNQTGIRYVMDAGNDAHIKAIKASNLLDIRMPTGGVRFVNNAYTISHFEFANNGGFAIRAPVAAIALLVEGHSQVNSLTIDNGLADGGNFTLASQGFTSWEMDNLSGVLRFIRAGTVHAQWSTAGLLTVQSGITSVGAIIGQTTLNITGATTLSGGLAVTGAITATLNIAATTTVDATTNFRSWRSSAWHVGGIFVPLSATTNPLATSARVIGTTTVTVTSWGVPAGCKAVWVRAYGKVATAADGNNIIVRKQGASDAPVIVRYPVATFYGETTGVVPINTSNEQIEFVVGGANTTASGLVIIGYFP